MNLMQELTQPIWQTENLFHDICYLHQNLSSEQQYICSIQTSQNNMNNGSNLLPCATTQMLE